MATLKLAEVIKKLKQHLKEGRYSYGRGDKDGQLHSFQQAPQLAKDNNLEAEENLFKGWVRGRSLAHANKGGHLGRGFIPR